jgi:uncharacterized protein (DUF58 family)
VSDTWLKVWSWHNLRVASAIQERLRRRFTTAGQAVLAATLSAALFGLDTRMTAAYQAFAFGAALLLVAALGTLRRKPTLTSERRLPRHATVGEPCSYRVTLRNTGHRPLAALELAERLPDPRPSRALFLAARAPLEVRLNPVERLFGYPRWEWLVRQGRAAEPQSAVPLPTLSPGEQIEQTFRITPTRRGWLRLDALVAARTDVLGLMRRETPLPGSDRLLVLPKRYPVAPLPQSSHRRLQAGGVNLASAVGDSREFMGLRDYLPGDSPRHIHWAAWARSGEPVVKEYQDEFFSRQALILDTFQDGGPVASAAPEAAYTGCDPVFECAVSVAASLVEPLTRAGASQDALLDLMFVADRAHTVTAGRGLLSGDGMLEVLACLEPNRDRHFTSLSELVLSRTPQLSAAICVLLAWDEPRQDLVQRLHALGLPLRILLITTSVSASIAESGTSPPPLCIDPADPAAGLAWDQD